MTHSLKRGPQMGGSPDGYLPIEGQYHGIRGTEGEYHGIGVYRVYGVCRYMGTTTTTPSVTPLTPLLLHE